jgi:hypothetical protein
MLKWFLRRALWDFIAWVKFLASKPENIPLPPNNQRHITPKPMVEAIPWLPLRNVMVCSRADVPRDERKWLHTTFYDFQVWLYKVIPPMQPGLPRIDADPERVLKHAFNGLRRTLFKPPLRPAEYLGSSDLGSLAVRGPFACYTTRSKSGVSWEWDLTMLNNYEHHPGLVKIGSRVLFRKDRPGRSLRAYRIECALSKKAIKPADPEWDQACKIVLCAASTHLSLVRHYNWVHLAGGAQLAIATRNTLSRDHPLCRLLWPYIYGTQQSNDMVTRGQMARGGDFETIFSLTFDEMCRLFDDTYLEYPHIVNDPETDGNSRGVRNAGFDTPTQQNLEALFCVMHCFVGRYLEIYFPRSAVGANAVQRDSETLAWLEELNTLLPNGVGVDPYNFTWDELARMVAGQLFLVTVQHEILGGFMWNYQLWTNRQPARIYDDFQAEPLDVYQRLVNANYNLNVRRRALMANFSRFGLDSRARAAILQFHADLAALQAKTDSKPRTVWRVYPRDLKVNINA